MKKNKKYWKREAVSCRRTLDQTLKQLSEAETRSYKNSNLAEGHQKDAQDARTGAMLLVVCLVISIIANMYLLAGIQSLQ